MKSIFLSLFFCCSLFAEGIEEAAKYNKNSQLQWDLAIGFIKKIDWAEEEKVLDVGCGDGKITALIADVYVPSIVVGADVSCSMVQFARERYIEPNLRFMQAGVTEMTFKEQFSKVVSFSALHWVMDQQLAFKKMYEALLPKGKIYVLTYAKAPMNISALAENLIYSDKWALYFPNYTPSRNYVTAEEICCYLEKAGFTGIVIQKKILQTRYPDRGAFKGFIEPLLSFAKHLPLELKDQFIEEMIDQVIALNLGKEIVFELVPLEISALKE